MCYLINGKCRQKTPLDDNIIHSHKETPLLITPEKTNLYQDTISSNGLRKCNINNLKQRKEPDLRDLLENRLLQFAYRTLAGIVQTFYCMAFGVAVFVFLVAIGLALS